MTQQRPWHRPEAGAQTDPQIFKYPVCLSPDYCAPLPLWSERYGNILWHFTGLSTALLDQLAEWQEQFDMNFQPEVGWSSAVTRDAWIMEASILLERLTEEFGARATVEVDLWPKKVH